MFFLTFCFFIFIGSTWASPYTLSQLPLSETENVNVRSVHINANKLTLGLPELDKVLIFSRVNGTWERSAEVQSPLSNTLFGASVFINNDNLLVGAPQTDFIQRLSGSPTVYPTTPAPTQAQLDTLIETVPSIKFLDAYEICQSTCVDVSENSQCFPGLTCTLKITNPGGCQSSDDTYVCVSDENFEGAWGRFCSENCYPGGGATTYSKFCRHGLECRESNEPSTCGTLKRCLTPKFTTTITSFPTKSPVPDPTPVPNRTPRPTPYPTTLAPTKSPTNSPTPEPTPFPTLYPTRSPTVSPTRAPTPPRKDVREGLICDMDFSCLPFVPDEDKSPCPVGQICNATLNTTTNIPQCVWVRNCIVP